MIVSSECQRVLLVLGYNLGDIIRYELLLVVFLHLTVSVAITICFVTKALMTRSFVPKLIAVFVKVPFVATSFQARVKVGPEITKAQVEVLSQITFS